MGFERQQFTFYRSFLLTAEALPPKSRNEFLLSVIRYALDGIEPGKLSFAARSSFEAVRPILDKARRKALSGKTGGEASGEARSMLKANRSKPEANRSTGDSPAPVITGGSNRETYTDTFYQGGTEQTGSDEDFPAPPEREELYQEIISQLCYYGISVGDKEKADIRALCDQYGGRAILDAIYAADQRNVRRWPYIRAIVTSGGVSHQGGGGVSRRVRESNAQCQRHDDPPSPASLKAAKDMLEWDGESWPPPE